MGRAEEQTGPCDARVCKVKLLDLDSFSKSTHYRFLANFTEKSFIRNQSRPIIKCEIYSRDAQAVKKNFLDHFGPPVPPTESVDTLYVPTSLARDLNVNGTAISTRVDCYIANA
jgi:hypothetical protein